MGAIKQGMCALGAFGVGAGLMYIFDPNRGRRRRAMMRDQMVQVMHATGDAMDKGLRDMNNRMTGGMIELVTTFAPARVTDQVLTSRIRSALGRCVSHPRAIEVKVAAGHVTLTGHILEQDVDRLIEMLSRVRGVKSITDEMAVHPEPGDVPDLQGRPHLASERASLEPNWTPATRLGVAAAGALLAGHGSMRRGLTGFAYGVLGLGMVARALKPSQQFVGTEMERGVDLQKTITIDAPLERVFRMLANPENFSRFMSYVHEVKEIAPSVYRWEVIGPGGSVAHWDAEITRSIHNEFLEWKTLPGSMVDHAGVVRLDPTPYGSTRVAIRLSYRPPLGKLGLTFGELFSLYPKHMLDDDLLRFKSLLEEGKTTAHHEKVTLEDVMAEARHS